MPKPEGVASLPYMRTYVANGISCAARLTSASYMWTPRVKTGGFSWRSQMGSCEAQN